MEIERIGPEAWARFRAVRLQALRDAPDAFGSTWAEEECRPPDAWRAGLEVPTRATWLARAGDADVGIVVADRYAAKREAAGLFGMWVHRTQRGQGVGDRLVEVVVAWAREQGYRRLLLDVGDYNLWARRLYLRHGFVATGRRGVVAPDRPQITERQLERDLALR